MGTDRAATLNVRPDIESRTRKHLRVPASLLVPHPLNTRGEDDPFQVSETTASLEGIGQVAELVTRPLPDGTYQLIDGHLRAGIAGDQLVDIGVTDLDDNEAAKAILALNQLAQLRNTDQALLAALAQQVNEATGLEGTGMDDTLLAALTGSDLQEFDGGAELVEGGIGTVEGKYLLAVVIDEECERAIRVIGEKEALTQIIREALLRHAPQA